MKSFHLRQIILFFDRNSLFNNELVVYQKWAIETVGIKKWLIHKLKGNCFLIYTTLKVVEILNLYNTIPPFGCAQGFFRP